MSTKNQSKAASVLAFERHFDVSDAVFFQQDSNNAKTPLLIQEKSVRGTISNRLKNATANDPAKLDAKIEVANLQRVDAAMLDNDKDTLIIKWSCKVLPFAGQPSICNDREYQKVLTDTINGHIAEHGFSELAYRYANNILNGRWLWRNRVAAQSIEIKIALNGAEPNEVIDVCDAKAYSLNVFIKDDNNVKKLAGWIEAGLLGKQFIIFEVTAKLNMGLGQEVYPSQELILDTGKTKSKVLYVKDGQAGMHSQKISNAIRTIDTWYEADAKFPIAIEPYGSVTTMGHAFRQPSQKNDFYTLFDNWILTSEKPRIEDQYYIIAILIRGGVFGASGKE